MDPLALKLTYELSLSPSKLKLKQFHEFLINYSSDKLNKNKILFFNALFIEIRKASEYSKDCISELLFLLKLLNNFEDEKMLYFVLEEISNFIQKYVNNQTKNKNTDDFSLIDLHLALEILKIFNIVFSQHNNEKVEKTIYSPSGLLLLGYVVSFLLFYCLYFKERDLQNEALSTLIGIVNYETIFVNKANIIVNLAPGIFQSLTKLIYADRKIGFSVKSKALCCLGKLIVVICGDQSNHVIEDRWQQYPDLANVVVQRDKRWEKTTWENIGKIIKVAKYSVLERPEEEHWRVKMELLKMSLAVLQNCSSVGSTAVDLVECLIVLRCDSDSTVKEEASRCIQHVSKMTFNIPIYTDAVKHNSSQIEHSGTLLLATVVRDNLKKVVEALKDVGTVPSDLIKCNMLQVVDGYLAIHAIENLPAPNCVQIKEILTHLTCLCRVDHNSLDLLEPIDVDNETWSQPHSFTPTHCELFAKQFVSFNNDKVYTIIQSIMVHLVHIAIPHSLVSMLQSLAHNQPEDGIAIILLTKLLMAAVTSSDKIQTDDKIALCKSVLTIYFDPEIMELVTVNKSNDRYGTGNFWKDPIGAIECQMSTNTNIVSCSANDTPTILKRNTLTLSMVMELCAACCLCVQQCQQANDEIDSWMMRTCLFEVMNKSQQAPNLLSHVASQCFHMLSRIHPKYKCSLPILIQINADYIMGSIARRLRSAAIMLRARSNDEIIIIKAEAACRSLIKLCHHADDDIIPFLQMILNQLLYCLDETHGAANRQFMVVLKDIMKAICRWNKANLSPIYAIEDMKLLGDDLMSNPVGIVRKFILGRNDLLISSGMRKDPNEIPIEKLEEDIEEDESHLNNEAMEEKREPLPITIIIQNIIDRCVNLMSNTNGHVRLGCLDIINDAVYALQKDEDILKVTVHQIWTPLEHRLWDKEYPVIIKAFHLINTISQLCPDFLFVKIKDGFVRKLCSLVERCATISASPTATMKYTGLYQLQINLLTFLSQLTTRTNIHGYCMEQVVDALLIYLDDRQPCQLIESCKNSLKLIFVNDPCLVWFKLAQILSFNLTDTEKNSSQIYGHVSRSYDTHYLANAKQLLNEFH